MTRKPAPIESPCINICRIEKASGLCIGCWRSIREITQWGRMAPEQRQDIMADLPKRKWRDRTPRA